MCARAGGSAGSAARGHLRPLPALRALVRDTSVTPARRDSPFGVAGVTKSSHRVARYQSHLETSRGCDTIATFAHFWAESHSRTCGVNSRTCGVNSRTCGVSSRTCGVNSRTCGVNSLWQAGASQSLGRCIREVASAHISGWPDWSVVGIYPRFLRMVGPS
eukprot:1176307-Prorocentrum_minimum.AAC.1